MYSLKIESYFVRKQENFKFFLKNVPKSFVGSGICCTFASAFASKLRFLYGVAIVLWTDLHRQRSSSTRSRCRLFCLTGGIWVNEPLDSFFLRLRNRPETDNMFPAFRQGQYIKDILQWRVWSWLRMNASYRLNTCKSRGSMTIACYCRWRPAHGWVTRIQPSRHSGIARRKAN